MATMLTTPDERPKRGNGAAHGAVLVSGNRLAVHFGCARQHVEQLAAQGVIERRADGKFDQDQSRLKYLAHLRSENRRSPRSAAEAAHASAKAELVQIRIAKERRELMLVSEHNAFVDELVGLFLTKLGGMPIRVGGHDLVARRKVEAIIFELRTELADACQRMADESRP